MPIRPLVGKGRYVLPLADQRITIWEGSVRSSKTVGSMLKWIEYVRSAPPGNLLMVGKTERTLRRNILDPITEWLGPKRAHLVAGRGEFYLCGRKVYVVGANDERSQDKIRGLSLLAAYVDEISLVPESFWSMLLSRLSEPSARLFGTTNPEGPSHWLKCNYLDRASLWVTGDGQTERYDGDDRLDLARFSFRLTDNPYLDPAYVRSLEREYVGLWHKRYIQGLWVAAEGAVFDMFDEARHVVDIVPPIERWLCMTVDYGTVNPLHALIIGLGADGRLYVVAEWRYDSRRAHRQLTDAEYSQRLRDWLTTVPIPGAARRPDGTTLTGVHPEYVVVDPSAASFRVQLHNDNLTNVAASNEVVDGIRLVSTLLAADKLKISRACPELIAELPGYSWDDKAQERGEDKPIKVADHGIDALRYGIRTTRSLWHSQIQLAVA